MKVILTILMASVVMLPVGVAADDSGSTEMTSVHYDVPSVDGSLDGGVIRIPAERTAGANLLSVTGVTTLRDSGSVGNRVDIVILGDGYTAAEMGTYAADAAYVIDELLSIQPFKRYADAFNIHRVDVVSNESGVDGDPTDGVEKDTALNAGFGCFGTARLLCVDQNLAWDAATHAPAADSIIVLANTSIYGGAGYDPWNGNPGIAVASAGNAWAAQTLIHEFGHSFGILADEYSDLSGTYSGGEPFEANASTLTAAEMAATKSKWWRWLGNTNPVYGGLVDTFLGAVRYPTGAYRPTDSSLMRNLADPFFNYPSLEALVSSVYTWVDPIDWQSDASPGTDDVVSFRAALPGIGEVKWYVDGVAVPGATGTTLDLGTLGFGPGEHTVVGQVTDPTPFVRDPAIRSGLLTGNAEFTVAYLVDVAGSVFASDIEWLFGQGITKGCNPPANDRFCPDANVTRGQMAAFLVRALGLSASGSFDFVDDDGSVFEADIAKLAEAGITKGCNPPANDRFCPDGNVTRGQMAAFLHRASPLFTP